MSTINYSLDGLDDTITELDTLISDWKGKQAALKVPALAGKGSTPELAREVALKYDGAYAAFVRLATNTKAFFAEARTQIQDADQTAANQFE